MIFCLCFGWESACFCADISGSGLSGNTGDVVNSSKRPSAVEMESPYTSSSTTRARPPKPSKQHEELRFPPGFLSPSSETKEETKPAPAEEKPTTKPDSGKSENINKTNSNSNNEYNNDYGNQLVIQSPDDNEPNYEIIERNQTTVYALLIAAMALGVFVFTDYRYRCHLQSVVSHNRQLMSPDAVSSDFDLTPPEVGSDPFSLFFLDSFGSTMPTVSDYDTDWTEEDLQVSASSVVPIPTVNDSLAPIKDNEFYV